MVQQADGRTRLRLRSRPNLRTWQSGEGSSNYLPCRSPCGRYVAVGNRGAVRVVIADVKRGKEVDVRPGCAGVVRHLCWTRGGSLLLGSDLGSVSVFRPEGEAAAVLKVRDSPIAAISESLSGEEYTIAVLCDDGVVSLFPTLHPPVDMDPLDPPVPIRRFMLPSSPGAVKSFQLVPAVRSLGTLDPGPPC
eukprot:Hpha_TRINITY_DN17173_c0_g1::TRINITY_DN17173_c0_g1_i1::g.146862::m.146862